MALKVKRLYGEGSIDPVVLGCITLKLWKNGASVVFKHSMEPIHKKFWKRLTS